VVLEVWLGGRALIVDLRGPGEWENGEGEEEEGGEGGEGREGMDRCT